MVDCSLYNTSRADFLEEHTCEVSTLADNASMECADLEAKRRLC